MAIQHITLPSQAKRHRSSDHFSGSSAVIVGDKLLLSGQTGEDPNTGAMPTNLEEEISATFIKINDAILYCLAKCGLRDIGKEEGILCGWDYVYRVRIYVIGLAGCRKEVCECLRKEAEKWYPDHEPISMVVGVEALALKGATVEVEVECHLG